MRCKKIIPASCNPLRKETKFRLIKDRTIEREIEKEVKLAFLYIAW
jgi:hypothetical protein